MKSVIKAFIFAVVIVVIVIFLMFMPYRFKKDNKEVIDKTDQLWPSTKYLKAEIDRQMEFAHKIKEHINTIYETQKRRELALIKLSEYYDQKYPIQEMMDIARFSIFQEEPPNIVEYVGSQWIKESTGQLFIFDGDNWLPIKKEVVK